MKDIERMAHSQVLWDRMLWFIRLRWIAGATVLLYAGVAAAWLGWHEPAMAMATVGAVILLYNVALRWLLGRSRGNRRQSATLAAVQIVLDLLCLTLLVLWTGGGASPLLGFYVLHMIFASLLLRPWMAYATAISSMAMMAVALGIGSAWPETRDAWLQLASWAVLLVLTVHLVNGMARRLRRQRHRLIIQNRRIVAMAETLKAQQAMMIQHEKLVAMGQMAAGIAHEIANPLSNLNSVLQLMQRNPARLNAENLDKLTRECDRIQQTIHQMREFVHPGHSPWRVMKLEELSALGLDMMRFHRQCECVRTQCEAECAGRTVRVQPQAMQQVLTNLLLNAVDAVSELPEDRRQVIVRTSIHDGMARIEVLDNGPGIPADVRERIFEPFFTTKAAGQGTGLGLAISYNLVASMGGRISVASEPGEGAAMRVELPLVDDTAEDPTDATRARTSLTTE